MPVTRYEIDAIEDTYLENGFIMSEGPIIRPFVSPEGEWVDYKDYEFLRKSFFDYHQIVLELLECILNDEIPSIDLYNKCSTAHNETHYIRKLINAE